MKSSFVSCHLLSREVIHSSACIYIMILDEDFNIAKKRLKLLEKQFQMQEKAPMAERGLVTMCSAWDSAVSKWSKATNLLIQIRIHFHLGALLPTCELQHPIPELFLSSCNMTEEASAPSCVVLLVHYSIKHLSRPAQFTCHWLALCS